MKVCCRTIMNYRSAFQKKDILCAIYPPSGQIKPLFVQTLSITL